MVKKEWLSIAMVKLVLVLIHILSRNKSNRDGAFGLNKDGSTTWNYIQYKNSGTRNFYTGITNLEKFVFGSDNGEPFYFTGSNVGISLNDPQANLDVQDVIRVSRKQTIY